MPEEITGRRCKTCLKTKHISEFPTANGRPRGECRPCFNQRQKGFQGATVRGPHVREEKLEAVVEHRLKTENRDLKARNEDLAKQLSEGGEYNEIVKAAMSRPMRRASIKPRERKSGLREATPLVLASDWHVEQQVLPEQVAGRNRYNLEISKRRMQRFFEAIRWAVKQQRDTFKIRDLILWLGGDFLQNFLHEDDVENNLLAPLDTIRFLMPEFIAGFKFLLEDPEIEQFTIPCNDGNHGRTTKKMRSSTRMQHSLEVFMYAQLALFFKDEPRLNFILPASQFTFLDDVYGRTIRFLHGDVFKYAGGVGGLMIPLMRSLARWETVRHADLTCLGHFHQRICLPRAMVNGSLVGLDPYAMGLGVAYEPPVQSLRMLDARRWCSADVPLWVSEIEDDTANKRAT